MTPLRAAVNNYLRLHGSATISELLPTAIANIPPAEAIRARRKYSAALAPSVQHEITVGARRKLTRLLLNGRRDGYYAKNDDRWSLS